MVAMQAPSMWQVAPTGTTTELTSRGTPNLSQASSCKGSAAAEDRVPRAVRAGVRMFLKKFFTPHGPAARKAYSARNTKKYTMAAG